MLFSSRDPQHYQQGQGTQLLQEIASMLRGCWSAGSSAHDRLAAVYARRTLLRYLGVERQLSPITLLNYRRQLKTLIALADSAGLKSWQQCDAAQVRSLAVRSRRQGLGPASLALRLRLT